MNHYKYTIYHTENNLFIHTNDWEDIEPILVLWGDSREWGDIVRPKPFLEEKAFIKELRYLNPRKIKVFIDSKIWGEIK